MRDICTTEGQQGEVGRGRSAEGGRQREVVRGRSSEGGRQREVVSGRSAEEVSRGREGREGWRKGGRPRVKT